MQKRIVLVAVVMILVGWAVYDFAFSKDTATSQPVLEEFTSTVDSDEIGLLRGQLAPDFELKTLKGETVRLSDYRGKRVLLNFWATWCPPCRAEMPDMQKLYKDSYSLNVEILAVNLTSTENKEEVVAPFVEEYGLTFPILMDRRAEVSNQYSVYAYPTTYMIDSSGRVQYIALGAINYDWMLQEVEKMK